ncbi:MAG: hypothetical protein K2K55_10635 [Duncaniella sp.]|nr:hypothetical protein [Duncaniella sp.]
MKQTIFSLLIFLSFGFVFEAEAGILKSKPRKSMMPEKVEAIVKNIKSVTATNCKKEWKQGREQRFDWVSNNWFMISDEVITYDQESGWITEVTGIIDRYRISYNPSGTMSAVYIEYPSDSNQTEWLTESIITFKYDEIVPDFLVELLLYEAIEENGEMEVVYGEREKITRNDDGNIISIEEMYFFNDPAFPDWIPGEYKTSITYGDDKKAKTITTYILNDFGQWVQESVLTDIVWDWTDGQIVETHLSDSAFYMRNTNRIKSASVLISETTKAQFKATYPAEGDFDLTISMMGQTIEQWVYVTEDKYGSYTSTKTANEENEFTGQPEEYKEIESKIFDAFGQSIYEAKYVALDKEIFYNMISEADVTYDTTYGYPLEYVYVTAKDCKTFKNDSRIVLSDYVEVTSAIGSVEADTTASAVYYNLQGLRIDNPTPGNLYIRRQGDKISKIIY